MKKDQILFDPKHRPGISRGMRFKGKTSFHIRAGLWDDALVEYRQTGAVDGPAVKKYEVYANWMEYQYSVLADSFAAAERKLRSADLDPHSRDNSARYDKAREQYIKKHSKPCPLKN